jgi:hypothetical protein
MQYAVIARDRFMGEDQLLHRFARNRWEAASDIRTPVSAFAFNERGEIEMSSHVPQPPC